eukprot:2411388-Rhodomonas_salina.1
MQCEVQAVHRPQMSAAFGNDKGLPEREARRLRPRPQLAKERQERAGERQARDIVPKGGKNCITWLCPT